MHHLSKDSVNAPLSKLSKLSKLGCLFFVLIITLTQVYNEKWLTYLFFNDDAVAVARASDGNAVTGSYFSGEKVEGRIFPQANILFRNKYLPQGRSLLSDERVHPECVKWAVVTTINAPTEAILTLSARRSWCTVIVADLKTPPLTDNEKLVFQNRNNVVFLSASDQRAMSKQFQKLFSLIPWNHFGRKNIGYLFAIQQGAKVIWDFDDDNTLLANRIHEFESLSDTPDLKGYVTVTPDVNVSMCLAYNPYPALGAPQSVFLHEVS
jgi:hypothetical protein